jgi:hypothetical protein
MSDFDPSVFKMRKPRLYVRTLVGDRVVDRKEIGPRQVLDPERVEQIATTFFTNYSRTEYYLDQSEIEEYRRWRQANAPGVIPK